MAACPACAYDNRAGAKFCSECGGALAAGAVPAREERKVVTVLFCDLVGFTSRAETMDPEDVRALLGRYHAHLRSELERFGGSVEKFIGDAVMAVFGAPVAHEDDPERAVRAALAIREWAEEQADVQVRVAVNTGEALVDLGARPELGEAMVAGDVVNAAARIQSAAPVNGILVGAATFRATRDVVDYREAEPVEAKGKAEPVAVWETLGARARFGVDVAERGGADLVGREREIDLLVGALERIRGERSAQLVTLVGVPGIGKSRLVHELFQRVADGSELTYWRQGRSLPYGEGVTFWALAEIAKSHAGILDTDTAAEAEEKLARALREALDGDEVAWVARHLRPLVGLGGEGEPGSDRRGEAFAAWRRLFEALAERRPLVLVFEDLQWADDGVLDFVDHLVDWAGAVPLLVVCTARPELLDRRPGWGGGKRNSAIVWLEPLDDEQTARLVHSLLERAVLPAETQAGLLARAGGNPLYAEEFVRMLADRGGGELPLPETVQGVIAARLDLLPPDEKALLQDAAVVGKVFWLGSVAALSRLERAEVEAALHRLEQRDYVVRSRRSSVAGETEYAFRHILVRDIAYGQIPRPARAERHRRAAEWIAALSAERSEDRAEMLAHHWLGALELARAAGQDVGELGERARLALRDAGDRALALSAFRPAIRFYREALELWPAADPERPRLLLPLGVALWSAEERGDELIAEARDLLLAAGDTAAAAEAEARLSRIAWMRGRGDEALERLERAVELTRGSPPSPGKAYVLCQAAARHSILGRAEDAIRFGNEALALATGLGRIELQADALNTIGSTRVQAGDFGGLAELERSVELARSAKAVELVRACNNLGFAYMRVGDIERAERLLQEALEAADAFGETSMAGFIRGGNVLGMNLRAGRWDAAIATCEEILREASGGEARYQLASALRVRALIRAARGDLGGALEDASRGVESARRALDPQAVCPSLLVQARVLLDAGRKAEAERPVEELLEIARGSGWIPSWELPVLAELLEELGRAQALRALVADAPETAWAKPARLLAESDFAAAADAYARLGAPLLEAGLRLRAAESLAAEGRRAEAEEQLERALSFYRSVGATAYAARAESLLAASA